jgi:predicted metalloprotease with PDZ domain
MQNFTSNRFILAALILLAGSQAFAQSLNYEVDITNTKSKRATVTLRPQKLAAKKMTFQMPAWAPGAYSLTNYGRYVKDVKAIDKKGKELKVTQVNPNRWEIANAQSLDRITYDVLDSHKDSTSLWFGMAHIDSMLFFANGTTLYGYVNDRKNVPATVTYKLPSDWEVATAADYAKPRSKRDCDFRQTAFKFKNYDELVDQPAIASRELQTRCFDQDGAHYEVVVVSQKPFQMDSLAEVTKQIVKVQTDFFKETPFKHYTFMYYNPVFQHMPSFNQGALEHMNASAYLLANIPWEGFRDFGLRIISHEFFHLWNVKRIHSDKLGPFDYTKAVETTSLWLSEGITDYYAHSLLARSGITTPASLLEDIRVWHANYRTSRPAKTMSLEEISRVEADFVIENAIVLYTKGPLVGMMLDAEIRSRTQNKKSLDDVMLALNADAKKGKHFKDHELIGKIGKIVGLDLSDFNRRYIAGTDTIDLEQFVNRLGLTTKIDFTEAFAGVRSQQTSNGVLYSELPPNSLLLRAGLEPGDTVVKINDIAATEQNIRQIIQDNPESSIKLEVRSKGEDASLRFTPSILNERAEEKLSLSFSPAGRLVFGTVPAGSFIEKAGFKVGDELVSVNGTAISASNLGELFELQGAEGEQVVKVLRGGVEQTINFDASVAYAPPITAPRLAFRLLKDQTPLQIAMRDAMIGRLSK